MLIERLDAGSGTKISPTDKVMVILDSVELGNIPQEAIANGINLSISFELPEKKKIDTSLGSFKNISRNSQLKIKDVGTYKVRATLRENKKQIRSNTFRIR